MNNNHTVFRNVVTTVIYVSLFLIIILTLRICLHFIGSVQTISTKLHGGNTLCYSGFTHPSFHSVSLTLSERVAIQIHRHIVPLKNT
jgi:hypothetical protein